MTLKRLGSMMAILAVLGGVGYTNMTPQQQGTLSGAAIGASTITVVTRPIIAAARSRV